MNININMNKYHPNGMIGGTNVHMHMRIVPCLSSTLSPSFAVAQTSRLPSTA